MLLKKRRKELIKMLQSEYDKLNENAQKHFLGEGVPFERVRRVSGYLSQDYRRWNDGKQAELKDRVKHSIWQ